MPIKHITIEQYQNWNIIKTNPIHFLCNSHLISSHLITFNWKRTYVFSFIQLRLQVDALEFEDVVAVSSSMHPHQISYSRGCFHLLYRLALLPS